MLNIQSTRRGGSATAGIAEQLEPRQFLSAAMLGYGDVSPGDNGRDGTAVADTRRHRHHAGGDEFVRADLVSDGATPAAHTDPNLKNPWGIAFNPDAFWWVANNHSSTSTLYDASGTPAPPGTPLVVNIPTPDDPTGGGAPTGIVFSGGSGFVVTKDGK